MIKSKLKASLLHLFISMLVVGCFLAFAITVWYPSPFLEISGLKNIILILVSVDLILGPLLTFVVSKPLKASLKFDLSMIVAMQVAALAYGMFTIYQGHPVYVAYAVDRFSLVIANESQPEQAKYDEFKVSKLWKPKLVYAKLPDDPKKVSDLLSEMMKGKPDIDARPELYEPFDKFAQDALKHGIAPEKLTTSANNKEKLAQFLSEHGKTASDYAFLPLSGKEKDVIWALSRETGKPVGVIDINPWQLG
jgi:hypothetical protein